jgi:peroxiredoxin
MSSRIDEARQPASSSIEAELTEAATAVETEAAAEEPWQVPPAQPLRLIIAILLLGCGAASYGYALVNFWSSPALGIHMATPYPAYLLIASGLVLALAALRVALGLWSPHAKLALAGISFLACITFAIGGGRFVSYTLRGTRNPPFKLNLENGERFPDFKLADQNNTAYDANIFAASPTTLVVIYRGDFCPFARFELDELWRHRDELRHAGIQVVAISADPPQRSAMLSSFLHSKLPLLSDSGEALLGPLGLVQHYSNGQPDSAIPAFILVDRTQRVRWIFTSRYYREQPPLYVIENAARASSN